MMNEEDAFHCPIRINSKPVGNSATDAITETSTIIFCSVKRCWFCSGLTHHVATVQQDLQVLVTDHLPLGALHLPVTDKRRNIC